MHCSMTAYRMVAALGVWMAFCTACAVTVHPDASVICSPGQSMSCACTNGSRGSQVCRSDRSGYDPCVCTPLPDVDVPGDVVRECSPGTTRSCYSGPAGTRGRGSCRDGMQTCSAGGSWPLGCEGQTIPSAETCNGADDDCDGVIDNGIDLSSDPNHCGSCTTVCPGPAHTVTRCIAGVCSFGGCIPTFGDCNASPADGCETDLRSPSNCGACGRACAAGQTCTAGLCTAQLTYTYVLDALTIDSNDNPDNPHFGFDLDGLYSTDVDPGGCYHPDFYALYDNDQHCPTTTETCPFSFNPGCSRTASGCMPGVDNQLPTLASTIRTAAGIDVTTALTNAVATSRVVVLVRVSAVDSLIDDPRVRVALYHAYPTFSSGCTSVVPGREYSITRNSLRPGGSDIDADAAFAVDGSIVAGRLRTVPAVDPITFAVAPASTLTTALPMLPSALHALRLRANITDSGLSNGVIGGWSPGQEIIDQTIAVAPDYASIVRSIVGGMIDMRIGGICDNTATTPPTYGGISAGYGTHGVPARISASIPVTSSPAPGTCGCGMTGGSC